jgi:hypothetical protein
MFAYSIFKCDAAVQLLPVSRLLSTLSNIQQTVLPNVKLCNHLLTVQNYKLSPQSLLCNTMEVTSRVLLTVSLLWPAYHIAGNAVHDYSFM